MKEASRVLYVAPHPDDSSIYVGATLAKYAQEGVNVMVLDVTDGEMGKLAPVRSGDPAVQVHGERAIAEFKRRRMQEERVASQALGVSRLGFLHFPDMGVDETVIPAIQRTLLQFDPHVVLAFDEGGTSYEPHKADHAWTGIATYFAVLNLALRTPNPIPSFRRLLTYTHPKINTMFGNYGMIKTSGNELVTVNVSSQVDRRLVAVAGHRTQAHLTGFFESTGLLHEHEDRFRERICMRTRTAKGTNDILFGVGEEHDDMTYDTMPLDGNLYDSNHPLFEQTLQRVLRVTQTAEK